MISQTCGIVDEDTKWCFIQCTVFRSLNIFDYFKAFTVDSVNSLCMHTYATFSSVSDFYDTVNYMNRRKADRRFNTGGKFDKD